MKRDKVRASMFTPRLSGPNAAATRRPLGVLAGAR